MNTLYTVRGGRPEDANQLLDIDIKCFEQAWSADDWSRVGFDKAYAISVATYFGTPIGFAIIRETDEGTELLKLAVKRGHRGNGISRELVDAVVSFARQQTIAREMYIIVPESMVYEPSPNVVDWLVKFGFKATKPILKRHFTIYGEPEDGVKFSVNLWNI